MSLQLRLLFYLLLLSLLSCSKNKAEEIKPKIGDVTESVYASGVIKAEGQYTVYATVNGTLQKVNVIAGQYITKGQSLFELESDKAELNSENVRLAYQLSLETGRYIQDKLPKWK